MNVGVVIPVRDGQRYLAEALESVLAQTRPPCDVVVVDDGSSDRTVALAQRYGPRVRCVSQAAAGIGAARNRGVAEAGGELLAFLDSDDTWPVDRLERQLEAFSAQPQPDVVFGHIEQFVSPELGSAARAQLVCPDRPQPAALANTMLVPRAVWDRVGPFSTTAVRSEFLDWLLRARELSLREFMSENVVLRRRLHTSNHGRVKADIVSEYALTLTRALDRKRSGQTTDAVRLGDRTVFGGEGGAGSEQDPESNLRPRD
jgi:glycosyltransferase involved in cell wall biosynthesis